MRYVNDIDESFIPEPDPSSGWGEEIDIYKETHEAEEAVEEVSHYEVVNVYPNGGKDVVKVIDVPGHPYIPAWIEYETVIKWHFWPPPPTVIAPDNMAAGTFAMVNGVWYEILENIPAGSTITPQNARETSLEEYLNSLKESSND